MAANLLGMRVFDVVLEITEDMLGTVPKDKKVYANYIAGKAKEIIDKAAGKGVPQTDGEPVTSEAVDAKLAEEVETVQQVEEKGWTGFHTDEQGPFLYDYAIKGFLCEAARTVQAQVKGDKGAKADEEAGTINQLGDKVKRFVFVAPRRVRLPAIAAEPLERPLRAMTAQGPRVTVVRSDRVEAGARINFKIKVLDGGIPAKQVVKFISMLFEYGEFCGLGQWRSGGAGRFTVVSMTEKK